jgi:amino acid adenylation domain-containing protein
MNLTEVLLDTAEWAGSRDAIVEGDFATSYSALASKCTAVGHTLMRSGVRPDDRVAIFLRRGADAAAALFGTLGTGAIAVMVNESLRPRQIEYILDHATATALISSRSLVNRLPRQLNTDAFFVDVDLDLEDARGFHPVARIGSDIAQIVYTSGSTGLPKGVTVSHGNLLAGVRAVVTYLEISREDKIASLLPFSFDYGLNQLFCCIWTGATLVVEPSSVPHRIVQMLKSQAVSVLPAVPPLWHQLLSVPAFSRQSDALRVMTNTGGHLPTEAVRRLREYQPSAHLTLMYGLTEAFRSTYLRPEQTDRKPNSIGRAIPGAEVLVLHDDSFPCKPREVGELVHRGPTVALGYWNDPHATAQVFRSNPLLPRGAPDVERVVFSGDLVYRDEDGDLFFVGRRDAMIKTLGYRVSPDEVVDALHASGEIAEAVVTSEPDEERGACIVAYVVLAPTGHLDQLRSFCSRELPRYMRPKRIEVRSTLQRTGTGKYDVRASARGSS